MRERCWWIFAVATTIFVLVLKIHRFAPNPGFTPVSCFFFFGCYFNFLCLMGVGIRHHAGCGALCSCGTVSWSTIALPFIDGVGWTGYRDLQQNTSITPPRPFRFPQSSWRSVPDTASKCVEVAQYKRTVYGKYVFEKQSEQQTDCKTWTSIFKNEKMYSWPTWPPIHGICYHTQWIHILC